MKIVRMRPPAESTPSTTSKQPLTETIIVPSQGNQKLWHKLSDAEFLKFTRDYIEKEGIRTSKQLENANASIYTTLGRRGLRHRITFDSNMVKWREIPDRGLLEIAQRLIEEKGLQRRSELKKEENGLYGLLHEKGLMGELHFEKRNANWISMDNEQLLREARRLIEQNHITSRAQLMLKFHGAYNVLHKRNLLEAAGFPLKRVEWGRMQDGELLAHARLLIEEKGLTKRKDFWKKFSGLSKILGEKGLFDQLPLEYHRGKPRNWEEMGEEGLVAFAKKFSTEEGISRRQDLRRQDKALHETLRKRGLLDAVFPETESPKQHRDWASMPNEEVLNYAKTFIRENKITSRTELQKADNGLYCILSERNLMDGALPSKQRRDWVSMSNEEVLNYAKTFIEENKITSRTQLMEFDSGLHAVLRKKKLLDAVFSDLEAENRSAAVQGVLDVLNEMGGSQ